MSDSSVGPGGAFEVKQEDESSGARITTAVDCRHMRRPILLFLLSVFCTATFVDTVSVYLLHDVDADQVGNLNQAFASVSLEAVVFTLIVGTGVALFTWIGTRLLHLKGKGARPGFALLLGAGVTVCQYLCDFATRALFPSFGRWSLTLYLVLAIAVCSVVFLRQKTADKL